MRVVLGLDPSDVEFCERSADGPHPYLDSVSDLRLTARAGEAIGIAATESSSVTVKFDNCERRVSTIIGRPLRIVAQIYDDADALFFEGVIASIRYGRLITLEVDA